MQEVTYVDRDRAAAVTIGSKDIKNDLRGKIKHSKSLGCLQNLPEGFGCLLLL